MPSAVVPKAWVPAIVIAADCAAINSLSGFTRSQGLLVRLGDHRSGKSLPTRLGLGGRARNLCATLIRWTGQKRLGAVTQCGITPAKSTMRPGLASIANVASPVASQR